MQVAAELGDDFDVSQTILVTLNEWGRVTHISRAGCKVLGRTRGDVLGADGCVFVPDRARHRVRAHFRRMLTSGGHEGHFRSPVLSRSCGERLIVWQDAPIRLADGRVAGVILSGLDVTDRERERSGRRRLLEELGDLKFALDQAAIVATTDVTGAITAVNDKFCEISKYSRQELLGQDHRIINSGYHDRAFFRKLWTTIAGGRIWRGEIRNRAKDGTLYWVDTTIVPFLDARGKPYQYMAIRHEVTERREAEARLRQQEALARLGEMAAVFAHEVKNPLAGISGALQVVRSRLPQRSGDERVLGDIQDRIASLNRMLQELLCFTRPGTPAPAPAALRAVVDEAAAVLRCDPALADVAIVVTGDEPIVRVDREQMHRAFLNLLLNAAEAMGGSGVIEVEIAAAHGVCRITVADRGPGIDRAVGRKVFQPFFTTKNRGAGLGLPTACRIVEGHGGSLEARPRTGGGLIVVMTLPLPGAAASA